MPTTALINRKMAVEAKAFTLASGMYIDAFATALLALNHGVCFIPKELGVFRVMSGGVSWEARFAPKNYLEFVTPMWDLMETSYADKFPLKFTKQLKRCHLYQYGAMATNQFDKFIGTFVEDLKIALENPSLMDRLLFYGIWFLGKVQFLMVRAYLLFRLRKINTDIFWRIIYRIKNPFKKMNSTT